MFSAIYQLYPCSGPLSFFCPSLGGSQPAIAVASQPMKAALPGLIE